MNEILAYAIGLGPYVLLALTAGIAVPAAMPWAWKNPEKWLFWIIFALSFGLASGDPSADGSVLKQTTWGTFFLAVAALLLFSQKTEGKLTLKHIPTALTVLMIWIFASALWSPEHFVSIKRAIQALGVVLVSLLIGQMALKGKNLFQLIAIPSIALIYIGLITAVVMHSVAFDTDGSFRGITSHKNSWGQVSLIASLISLFLWMDTRRRLVVFFFVLLPCVASLVLTRSTTSLLAFLLIAGGLTLWQLIFTKGTIGKVFLLLNAMGMCVAFLIYLVYTGDWPIDALSDFVYKTSGKDQSLTGRKYLWELMFLEISRHPWIGIGYGGFWTNGIGPSSALVAKLNWGPPVQAHSGYIDIVNDIGIIGASIFSVLLLLHLRNIYRLANIASDRSALFHFAVLISALLINYAESSLLRTTHIWWMLICASLVEVHLLTLTPKAATNSLPHSRTTTALYA